MKRDWRLEIYSGFLNNKTFEFRKYRPVETNNDHDHCELCFKRFSYTVDNDLKEGYAYYNELTNQTNWICKKCFNDFKEELSLKVKLKSQQTNDL